MQACAEAAHAVASDEDYARFEGSEVVEDCETTGLFEEQYVAGGIREEL